MQFKKRISVIFLEISLVVSCSIPSAFAQISDQKCSARYRCPQGLQCYRFPDLGLRCAKPNPCSYYQCPADTQCALLEMHPGKIICSKLLDKCDKCNQASGTCAKEGETSAADIACCEGSKAFQNYILETHPADVQKPECVGIGEGIRGHQICLNCKDGICGIGENQCNCPDDCDPRGCVRPGEKYAFDDGKRCCAGLKPEGNPTMQEDGSCLAGGDMTCLKCHDGICGEGENGCNCPQDCKDFKCKGHGEIPRYTAPGDDMSIQCCQGLKHGEQKEYCGQKDLLGYWGICLACGDGVCDEQYENKCNCPEDCGKSFLKKTFKGELK